MYNPESKSYEPIEIAKINYYRELYGDLLDDDEDGSNEPLMDSESQ
jgi:hypothetical protein